MMADAERFDVVIVGGGSGLTAASFAQKDGKRVALVDSKPDALGGTCVNRGCLPTKGMIHAADVLRTIQGAKEFGIEVVPGSVRVDFGAIMERVRAKRERDAKGVRSWVEDAFTPYFSEARFVDEKILETEDGKRITGDAIFLATGARPTIPPIEGLDDVDYLTNESVIELEEQPKSLIVLGAGYIGCEFGHFFSSVGTDVTVIDRSGCLKGEDEDIRSLFEEELGKQVELHLGTDVVSVTRDGKGVTVVTKKGDEERTLRAAALLVATGRRPNTDALDFDKTGVKTSEQGWIEVDDQLRTSHPDIYAYGDVIGKGMFKHTSSKEGEIAYRNSQGGDLTMSYEANPHAVFTHPQIGGVGLTERECKEQGLDYVAASAKYEDFAKGEIIGSPPGLAKAIVDPKRDRILGFHMAGPSSAIMIHEIVAAMNSGAEATAKVIRDSIHTHPTLPELVAMVFGKAASKAKEAG